MKAPVGCREVHREDVKEVIVVGNTCGGKLGSPWKQGSTAESHVGGGAITTASLAPHASMAAEQ